MGRRCPEAQAVAGGGQGGEQALVAGLCMGGPLPAPNCCAVRMAVPSRFQPNTHHSYTYNQLMAPRPQCSPEAGSPALPLCGVVRWHGRAAGGCGELYARALVNSFAQQVALLVRSNSFTDSLCCISWRAGAELLALLLERASCGAGAPAAPAAGTMAVPRWVAAACGEVWPRAGCTTSR